MGTTIVIYILYGFLLYSAYCFGIGAKTGNDEMIHSTASVIRLLFFIKSSVLFITAYLAHGGLDVYHALIYGADTLAIFIFTHFVFVTLEEPMLVVKKRRL